MRIATLQLLNPTIFASDALPDRDAHALADVSAIHRPSGARWHGVGSFARLFQRHADL
jgi:hypothetical protein